jgi:hypothetical protein
MNDTLASARSPATALPPIDDAVRTPAHLTFTERLQFRVGLWLLLRSAQRHHYGRDHHEHARRLANARLHDERDRDALRSYLLQGPRL